MENIQEALRIDGFDAETQKAFDKLCAYLAVFKHRANPASPRYVTKLNDFQLKFLEFVDKAESNRAKLQVKSYITEIQNMLEKAVSPATAAKAERLGGGGKLRKVKPEKAPVEYVNPNDGGLYQDGDVTVYEAPADEDPEVQAAIETIRRRGGRVTR